MCELTTPPTFPTEQGPLLSLNPSNIRSSCLMKFNSVLRWVIISSSMRSTRETLEKLGDAPDNCHSRPNVSMLDSFSVTKETTEI